VRNPPPDAPGRRTPSPSPRAPARTRPRSTRDLTAPDAPAHRRFPFTGEFEMPTGTVSGRRVTELALQHDLLTEDRVERMRRVASERCFDVVPVVEGLHDVGNIAAVARTADALGFGRLHVIKQDHDKYKRVHRKVSSGSDKWLHEEVRGGIWGGGTLPAGSCGPPGHAALGPCPAAPATRGAEWLLPSGGGAGVGRSGGVAAEAEEARVPRGRDAPAGGDSRHPGHRLEHPDGLRARERGHGGVSRGGEWSPHPPTAAPLPRHGPPRYRPPPAPRPSARRWRRRTSA